MNRPRLTWWSWILIVTGVLVLVVGVWRYRLRVEDNVVSRDMLVEVYVQEKESASVSVRPAMIEFLSPREESEMPSVVIRVSRPHLNTTRPWKTEPGFYTEHLPKGCTIYAITPYIIQAKLEERFQATTMTVDDCRVLLGRLAYRDVLRIRETRMIGGVEQTQIRHVYAEQRKPGPSAGIIWSYIFDASKSPVGLSLLGPHQGIDTRTPGSMEPWSWETFQSKPGDLHVWAAHRQRRQSSVTFLLTTRGSVQAKKLNAEALSAVLSTTDVTFAADYDTLSACTTLYIIDTPDDARVRKTVPGRIYTMLPHTMEIIERPWT